MDIARGNWIGFVDSDDWLESNALEVLYKKQKDTDADIVMGGFREIYPNYTAPYLFPSVTATDDILVYFFNNRCKFLHGKLYRKYLFDNYYVPKTNIGEDALVSVQLFAIITHEKLQKVDLIIYNYDRRTGGIMSQFSNTTNYKAFTDYPMLQACLFMENMVDKIHQNKEIYSSFLRYMLVVGIIPYLSFNRLKSKKEVNLFYQTYYRPCEIKHKIHFINRMIVPLFRFSMGIGTVYVFLLNRVEFLRPFIKRIFYR
ncbi:hypothetical protein FACS189461_1740 [Spirochaetia bacterium]|nr:hypothetical protein FACS189461_1740 [Spirochaetia bacterium]